MTTALDSLNTAPRDTAAALIAPLVERSPWVAAASVDARPFDSDEDLARALVETVLAAGVDRRLAMFRVHPELAGAEAATGRMTAASTSEQGRLGLLALTPDQARRLARLNDAYRQKFGHPFIIALHRVTDLATLFATFEQRLAACALEEHITTLAEITSVIRSRAAQAFGPDVPAPALHPSSAPSSTF